MNPSEPKAVLHFCLQSARDALLWKLDGLSEYDVRRPLTPTGTNLRADRAWRPAVAPPGPGPAASCVLCT